MSGNDFVLNASVRTDLGKGASRRLRRLNNEIPAVLYGGKDAPVSLTIAHDDIFHATENEAFFSHIITLNIGKKQEQAVIKDLQRHPAKPFIMHADFLRVQADQTITVNVPLHFINEEKAAGVKLEGGSLFRSLNEIEVSCLPKDLPEYIEVDVIDLGLGDTLHLSDITLPEGVTSIALSHGEANDHAVASIQTVRGAVEEEEAEDTGEEGEAPAAGEGEADDSSEGDD